VVDYDLQTLRLFAAVVDARNIAHAAKACNIAASAISKRVNDLETDARVKLLYRLRDGVAPTDAGLALYRYAQQILALVGKLNVELGEHASGLKDRIRIWANTSAVTQFLPDDLMGFSGLYPDVLFHLTEETSAKNIAALNNGTCDVAIFSEHVAHDDIQTRVFRRDTLKVVVPAQHELAGRDRVSLSETLAFDHVGLQEGSSLQAKVQREASERERSVRFRVQVLSFDGVRHMVEAGLGVSILPEGAVRPYLGSMNIASIDLDEPWATRALLIGYRDFDTLSLASRRLLDYLAPSGASI
jgi:DNA-binding transcriptional LysR family regulator